MDRACNHSLRLRGSRRVGIFARPGRARRLGREWASQRRGMGTSLPMWPPDTNSSCARWISAGGGWRRRVGGGDGWGQVPGTGIFDEPTELRRRVHGRPDQRSPQEAQHTQIDLDDRAGDGTTGDQPPARAQRSQQCSEGRAPDHIGDDSERSGPRQLILEWGTVTQEDVGRPSPPYGVGSPTVGHRRPLERPAPPRAERGLREQVGPHEWDSCPAPPIRRRGRRLGRLVRPHSGGCVGVHSLNRRVSAFGRVSPGTAAATTTASSPATGETTTSARS